MFKKAFIVLGAVLMALAVAEAGAGRRARPKRKRQPKAKVRDRAQRKRIRDGVKDGSLTRREAGKVAREQKKIRGMAKDITSDGEVTRKEKAILDRAQDKASAHIFKERHDDQGSEGPKPRRNWKLWDPGVNHRQRNQHLRIAQGIKSGSLTKDETRQLISTESEIRKLERDLKSDGVLTVDERKQLHQALNDASKVIFDLKHNDAGRPKLRRVIVAKVDSGDLTQEEAKELLAMLRRISQIRRRLAGAPLPPEKRAELEAEFADLASRLFE